MYYIGLDLHKKTIRYCAKDASGPLHNRVPTSRFRIDANAIIDG